MTAAAALSLLTGSYTLDPSHTRIGFVARHAMVTKVRGSFNDFEGHAVLDGDDPSRSTASVTIQVASIDTRSPQRDEHLRSNDFLAIAEFPTITFVSSAVRQAGEAFELDGDLTLRGVTRPITIPFTFQGSATDVYGNSRVGFEGSVAISRKDFGVIWNAALETGGVMVSDKIVLEFEVSAIKGA